MALAVHGGSPKGPTVKAGLFVVFSKGDPRHGGRHDGQRPHKEARNQTLPLGP